MHCNLHLLTLFFSIYLLLLFSTNELFARFEFRHIFLYIIYIKVIHIVFLLYILFFISVFFFLSVFLFCCLLFFF